jgi:LEA14-like dessication related protein
MDNSKNQNGFILWGLLVAGIVGFLLWFRTNTKKLMNLTEYSIVSVKVHKVGVLETQVKVSVLIKNPSDLAIKLNNYKVDVNQQSGEIKKLLATSEVTSLTIPAKSSVVNDIMFNISNLEVGGMLLQSLKTGLESQLKGKISFLIKGEALGQYFEKEIKY